MTGTGVRFATLTVGSPEHAEAIRLREAVLRVPLGLGGLSAEERAAEPNATHLACFIDERVVGTLLLSAAEPGVMRMRQVAVAPELRGSGIGTRLVEAAEMLCQARGTRLLFAHAREPVVSFYEHLGYEVVGEPFVEVTIEHRRVEKRFA